MFSQFKNRESYPFWFEMAPLLLTVALLMVQFFVFKDYTPHVPLVIGICITGMFMALKGRKWAGMEQHMYRVMKVALPTTVIILCVGMMIAASIAAGTVQTVLVYGLSILKPTVFLPATCILTTVVSLATGTSWGTVGTVGLAMVGIGEALGVPMHWTVGAICSGSFFGDKMSPLSDTTNLSPAVAGTDIWSHIKAMLPNTIPAYAITIVVYALVSLHYGGDAGEIYTSLVLPGRLMKGKFAEMGYDRAILSRTLEDWGTLVSPLIPWNNGGAFVTATLGLSTFIYAPFALFCWLSPLIGLIYAAFGWFTPLDPRGPQTLADEDMEEIADEVDDYMV